MGDGLPGVDGAVGPVPLPGLVGPEPGFDLPGCEGDGDGPAPGESSLRPEGTLPLPFGISWVPLR